ncbi:MAG: hypothetical protein JNM66_06490 [Bryobacterales bacterium]|nr:hypothetical protein [Bryobacterales bacterium]
MQCLLLPKGATEPNAKLAITFQCSSNPELSGTAVRLSGQKLTFRGFNQKHPICGCPERLTKGLARYPVPIMLLARLAVAANWQGRGLGAGLLKDAMLRTLQAADIAGLRLIKDIWASVAGSAGR